ncbi:alpha/beta hydrolase [Devosia ginsengisoli]|uniref:alpha/beta hydrolase n=1 Tax=Devosia ginsengisoli TaxID=400770 RepID=UPI0026F090CC|nr:alpha/beta hydrolase [Devosia ginsengisoli]MCR6671071.1 alpha/beta hydrolase [Devosia ginsengisoli]
MSDPHSHEPSHDRKDDSIGRIAELIGGDPMQRLDADMKHVLDRLTEMGARPLELLSPDVARRQPRPAEAISAILGRQGRERPDDGVEAEDIVLDGAEGDLPGRIYRPLGLLSRLNPMVLYFHGGGFVTGDLDSHDASARAIARRTGAIVVSVAYRLAPEHPFPAAHDDAWAAWNWLNQQAKTLAGDKKRLALAGEDAGANLAAHVALRARAGRGAQPVHQVLIHPIAGNDMTTASYGETLRARPIGLPAMRWRFRQVFADEAESADARINLVAHEDWAGVAPATIVLAGIDPLRSEGEALAEMLEQAGVAVNCWTYEGVVQGFSGSASSSPRRCSRNRTRPTRWARPLRRPGTASPPNQHC